MSASLTEQAFAIDPSLLIDETGNPLFGPLPGAPAPDPSQTATNPLLDPNNPLLAPYTGGSSPAAPAPGAGSGALYPLYEEGTGTWVGSGDGSMPAPPGYYYGPPMTTEQSGDPNSIYPQVDPGNINPLLGPSAIPGLGGSGPAESPGSGGALPDDASGSGSGGIFAWLGEAVTRAALVLIGLALVAAGFYLAGRRGGLGVSDFSPSGARQAGGRVLR